MSLIRLQDEVDCRVGTWGCLLAMKVVETREVSENVYLDLDEQGNLVSMTLEHAGEKANIEDFSFERSKSLAS